MTYLGNNKHKFKQREDTTTPNLFEPMYNYNYAKNHATNPMLKQLCESLIRQAQYNY